MRKRERREKERPRSRGDNGLVGWALGLGGLPFCLASSLPPSLPPSLSVRKGAERTNERTWQKEDWKAGHAAARASERASERKPAVARRGRAGLEVTDLVVRSTRVAGIQAKS